MSSPAGSEERQPLLSSHAEHSPVESSVWRRFWHSINGLASSLNHLRVALKDFLSSSNKFLFGNPILLGTFCLQFCTYFAKHLVEVPMIRLFEQAVCNRYYDIYGELLTPAAGAIEEYQCKIPAIQNEVAGLVGLKFTFDALPALLTALYYGSIADRFGRRLVLALSCAGTLCSFLWILFICYAKTNLPIKLVWASSAFLLVGGSQRVAKGMNFTIVADAVDKSHRTRYMLYLAGIPHLTTLVTPPLSGLLMALKIWLPFVVAIGALAMALVIILLMPESLNYQHHPHLREDQNRPLLGAADAQRSTESRDGSTSPLAQSLPATQNLSSSPSHEKREGWRDIVVLVRLPGLPFCYLLFFFMPFAMISKAFVYQYASYNFDWALSQTTWLRFAQAGGSSLATIAILPSLSAFLHRRGLQAQALDLNVIRVSLSIAVIGFVLLQLSYHGSMLLLALFICGLSGGEEPALQSLTTTLIDRSYHAKLFTSVAVVEIVAKLVSGPIMGKLFSISQKHGPGSSGICFLVSAGIIFLLLIMASMQRLERQ